MNPAIWYFVLVCVSGPTCTPGAELSASKAGNQWSGWALTREDCAAEARTIAQAMFVDHGDKYGFRCQQTNFEPPDMGDTQH